MVTPDEFHKAVETIHKALRDRVVTMGLTSRYNCMHHIIDELVITGRHPKPRATYYYEEYDGYNEKKVMGTQDNFEVAVMTAEERIQLDVKNAKTRYEAALKDTATALAAKEKELAQSQTRLHELELELAKLNSPLQAFTSAGSN